MSEAFFPHSYLARYPRPIEGADPDALVVPAEHPPHRGTCLEYETTLASQVGTVAPGPVCQYCLADPRYTPIAPGTAHRCPLCGAPYRGPRRDREFRALLQAGLVASGE